MDKALECAKDALQRVRKIYKQRTLKEMRYLKTYIKCLLFTNTPESEVMASVAEYEKICGELNVMKYYTAEKLKFLYFTKKRHSESAQHYIDNYQKQLELVFNEFTAKKTIFCIMESVIFLTNHVNYNREEIMNAVRQRITEPMKAEFSEETLLAPKLLSCFNFLYKKVPQVANGKPPRAPPHRSLRDREAVQARREGVRSRQHLHGEKQVAAPQLPPELYLAGGAERAERYV